MPELEQPPAANDPRIEFAAERTLLAWIRTSLALMGFGFVVARFGLFLREIAAMREAPTPPFSVSFWVGTTLIFLGVTVLVVAAIQHVGDIRRLRTQPLGPIRCSSLGIVLTLILAVIGAGLAVYLIATTGAAVKPPGEAPQPRISSRPAIFGETMIDHPSTIRFQG